MIEEDINNHFALFVRPVLYIPFFDALDVINDLIFRIYFEGDLAVEHIIIILREEMKELERFLFVILNFILKIFIFVFKGIVALL